ncbi:alcohol dehydrogenase catalytic domain-containing protein [Pseudomonas sp. PSKL.D1]|uniref:alcohol dehydrogenase catalytic domain-containing protein n=1 Tax=Pseudomonas sp. PSKL.D1 TaxID=3029060 RepID=UPI00238134F5|nr:alcohol dehydrogenase catalytic domain-containing protein [Pseudomonas sp. PSKL.D1]WDY56503.1 alcohol dehydrogenase catalytic domain-containing protein [Pseudomonas sp. PSKL.D1]
MADPGAGDVLIRNVAIGLNPVDWKVLGGDLVNWQPGHVPGVDGVGVVVAVGEGVPAAWVGQRVAYHQSLARDGSFAEYCVVQARVLLRLPACVDWATAASLPCPALTAWLALEKLPASCKQLLITGAGGSVAHHLIQMASRRGLAITALSHPRHTDRLISLGAGAWSHGPLEGPWQGPECFDAVIDTVNAQHAEWLAPSLRANGHLVCVQDRLNASPVPPFTRTLSLHEVALGAAHAFGDDRTWRELVHAGELLFAELGSGQWVPDAVNEAPFEHLALHLAGLQGRTYAGKAIVRLDPA